MRPKLDIPRSTFEVVLEALAAVGLVVLLGLFLWSWQTLPDRVPTHFDAFGNVDAWGSKSSLVLLPVIGLVLWSGLTVLARFPHVYNYVRLVTLENAERQYAMARAFITLLKAEMVWMFGTIEWMSITAARGEPWGAGAVGTAFFTGLILLSAVVYVVRSWRAA